MALVPEYIYPNRPSAIVGKTEDLATSLVIGALNDEIHYHDNKYVVTDVKDLDWSGYFDNLSDGQEQFFEIFTFKNDVVLGVKRYKNPGYGIQTHAELRYQGQKVIVAGFGNQQGIIPVNISSSNFRTSFLDPSGCKMIVGAYFENPTENVTACLGISFIIFFPASRAFEVPFGLIVDNDLSKLETGFTGFKRTDLDGILYDGNKYEVSSGLFGSVESVNGNEITISNMTAFNNAMKLIGSGTDEDVINPDPYKPIPAGGDDPSKPGGGGGNYDKTSDPIDFPTLPTGGALTSGMIKGFVISAVNLDLFQNKLWDMSLFDIATQFQKLLNQPLDCLISLHAMPVLPQTGSPEHVMLGSFDTEVSALVITNQYVVVDCGSLKVPEFYGSALDYGPFSRAQIMLPFIGFREIEIDDVNTTTISLKYYVDVLTGACVAFIKCGQSVLYSFTGSCIQHIPVSATSSDLLKNTISAIGPVAVGIAAGNPASVAAGSIAGAINTASAKNHVSRTGDLAGSAGILGEYTPYMIFHRPKQSLALNYNQFKGYPSNITYKLGDLKGYTEVEHIHLTGISGATDTELKEIEDLLKKGVII